MPTFASEGGETGTREGTSEGGLVADAYLHRRRKEERP